MGSLPARNFSALSDSAPLCRQFWKAGEYEVGSALRPSTQNSQNRLRVHPKFLHSNATSHKWAFGAIAELLDNAVDEVQHGATYVSIDQIINPRNGEHALVIQDDGGGLTPDSMRCCMSFGFSNKQADVSIGQYGNGLKTSTMRLGADAIVFSRSVNQRTLTQSVGLLSYTFLRDIVADDTIVPMVDYEFHPETNDFRGLVRGTQRQFSTNLSAILKWSPFATEVELLKQFDGMGLHGTKIIIFNLWFNDDGRMELDFVSDAKDIMVSGAPKIVKTNSLRKMLNQKHIATRYRYSLQIYSSILYMHLPANFKIFLRGKLVEPHHITTDMNYIECISYKPHNGGGEEVVTHIGFLKGAPDLNVHGFNVYHRNRLILPFWSVLNNGNQCRKSSGVAGVLEANFIRPTHDKQDFEKSTLYQKLQARLKDMTMEYWNYHCHLVGHPATHVHSTHGRLLTDPNTSHQSGLREKGKRKNQIVPMEPSKRQATGQAPAVLTDRAPAELGTNHQTQATGRAPAELTDQAPAELGTNHQTQATGRAPAELETNLQRKHGYSGGPSRVGEASIIMQTNLKLHAENYHCHLVGHPTTRAASTLGPFTDPNTNHQSELGVKSEHENQIVPMEPSTRQDTGRPPTGLGLGTNHQTQATGQAPTELETNQQRKHGYSGGPSRVEEVAIIMQTNLKLRAECLEYEKAEKELILKAERLQRELEEYEQIYENIMMEIKSMEGVKVSGK